MVEKIGQLGGREIAAFSFEVGPVGSGGFGDSTCGQRFCAF